MRFLVDAQLPPAMAIWLRDQGHSAEHVADKGLASASDMIIWREASKTGAAIITKDEDFARLAVQPLSGPPVVWIRLPNTRRRELLAWFQAVLPTILEALDRGETLIEVIPG